LWARIRQTRQHTEVGGEFYQKEVTVVMDNRLLEPLLIMVLVSAL
jgi:hypothetical protein